MGRYKSTPGLVWLLTGPAIILALFYSAFHFIGQGGGKEINNPVIWTIIILIFVPIALGLLLFGWYAWKGEYDHLPEDSAEL